MSRIKVTLIVALEQKKANLLVSIDDAIFRGCAKKFATTMVGVGEPKAWFSVLNA